MMSGEIHGQMAAPGVSHHVGTLHSDCVQHRHGVGHMGPDVERTRRRRGGESTLLIAVDGESVIEFSGECLGVLREARATVKHQHWGSGALAPGAELTASHRNLEFR